MLMRGARLLLMTVPLAVTAAAEEEQIEDSASLEGRIQGEDGEPIVGAELALWSATDEWWWVRHSELSALWATSKGDGGFSYPVCPAGEIRIRARATGYATAWFRGSVVSDGTLAHLRLPRGHLLRVTVANADGAPVPGADVALYPEPHVIFLGAPTMLRWDRSATTGADGTALLTGLLQRRYRIVASASGQDRGAASTFGGVAEIRVVLGQAEGYREFKYDIGLSEVPDIEPSPPRDEPQRADADVPRGHVRLRVSVVTADGLPVRWARVCATSRTRSYFKQADNVGIALLDVMPSTYEVWAEAKMGTGRASTSIRARLAERHTSVKIPLTRIHAVPVDVRDAAGRPLPNTQLEVHIDGQDSWWGHATGADGMTTLFEERDSLLRIVARPPGLSSVATGPIRVPVAGPVHIVAPRPETVRGRVVSPGGEPLFGVAVTIRRADIAQGEEEWETGTNNRGEFECIGPAAGTYALSVRPWAYRDVEIPRIRVPQQAPLEIRLLKPFRIRGRVRGSGGEPLGGVLIECDDGDSGRGCTNADGTFEFIYRGAGRHARLALSRDGFGRTEVLAGAEQGEGLQVRLVPE